MWTGFTLPTRQLQAYCHLALTCKIGLSGLERLALLPAASTIATSNNRLGCCKQMQSAANNNSNARTVVGVGRAMYFMPVSNSTAAAWGRAVSLVAVCSSNEAA